LRRRDDEIAMIRNTTVMVTIIHIGEPTWIIMAITARLAVLGGSSTAGVPGAIITIAGVSNGIMRLPDHVRRPVRTPP
jgi:hypothetical protein